MLLFLGRVARRTWDSGLLGRLRRGAAWVWRNRVRRLAAVGLLAPLILGVGGVVWYSIASVRARAHFEAVYEQIGDDVTEADVTAMVGRPPDDGPVEPAWGRLNGGGENDIPVTARKWARYGTEMVVHFGEDGTAKASFISPPPRGVLERVVDWLGW